MDASGCTREGWMIFVPVTVLSFIVMYVMGGPAQFMNVVGQWTEEAISSISRWAKYL